MGWLNRSSTIKSAVLFGSSAAVSNAANVSRNQWADIDLHLVVADSLAIENSVWSHELPEHGFSFQTNRPATGSVRKITLVFASGQIDLVIVPIAVMYIAAIAFRTGLYRKIKVIGAALNEMATCLHAGYCFLKGQHSWENFYNDVYMLPGVRLGTCEIRNLANASVCDVLWLSQKIAAGELIAAQHVLHSRVSDTNLRLWRELQIRQTGPLQSFGLGRRLEQNVSESDRRLFTISARLTAADLLCAGTAALRCLKSLMVRLDPEWTVPQSMAYRLEHFLTKDYSDDSMPP